MDFKSHMTGGLIFGIGTVYLATKSNIEVNTIALVGASIAGSLLPDIDHPKSFLGNKVPILPSLLYKHIGYRTLTHSLLFAFITGVLVGTVVNLWLGVGLAIGIISHILLDLLTPQGVALMYPFNRKKMKLF